MIARALLLAMVLLGGLGASAQTVTLQGVMGRQALLVVDGGSPRGVAPGDSYKGVKVISTSGELAVIEVGGQRQTLRVGESPVSIGGRRSRNARHAHRADGRQRRPLHHAGLDQRPQRLVRGGHRRHARDHERRRRATPRGELPGRRAGLLVARPTAWCRPGASSWLRSAWAMWNCMTSMRSWRRNPCRSSCWATAFSARFQMKRDNDQMVLERRY